MKEKMKRDKDERKEDFCVKNVSEPSNPPEELAQHVSKKIFFGRIVRPFFFERAESDRFSMFFHDSNSIFRAGRINSENVPGCTVQQTLQQTWPSAITRPGRV